MKLRIPLWVFAAAALTGCSTTAIQANSDPEVEDRAALDRTGQAIRDAFARGDVAAAMSYHHPDVEKALAWDLYLVGRAEVRANLASTLSANTLEFVENQRESLAVRGDVAVEQVLFGIRGTPKDGGDPFLFRGRTSVIYVRHKESPTGWATLREIIQPAPAE